MLQTHPSRAECARADTQVQKDHCHQRAPPKPPPSPLRPPPTQALHGRSCQGGGWQSRGPRPGEQACTHCVGPGCVPRAEGQIYKVPVGPTLSLAAAPCVPGVAGCGGGCLASRQSWLPRLLSVFVYENSESSGGCEEASSLEGTCPPLLRCYRHWGWGHSAASQSVRTHSGRGNPLPQEERQVP